RVEGEGSRPCGGLPLAACPGPAAAPREAAPRGSRPPDGRSADGGRSHDRRSPRGTNRGGARGVLGDPPGASFRRGAEENRRTGRAEEIRDLEGAALPPDLVRRNLGARPISSPRRGPPPRARYQVASDRNPAAARPSGRLTCP